MKYWSLSFAFVILLAISGFSQGEKFVKDVDVKTFKELVDKGNGIILDVRTPQETAQGQIPNASTINFYDKDFEKKINFIQKDKEIYVYCLSGGRSAQAAQILAKNGFDRVYNLSGGIMAWKNSNFPLTEPSSKEDSNIQTLNLDDFKKMIATDQPALIDFHTVWCAPCRKMAPVIDEIEKEYVGKAVVKRVDVDKSQEVAKTYEISGVPVFMLFVNGKAVWTHNGIISKEDLIKEINQYVEKN